MGSEEGVGWNWAVEVARLGHEVLALTETENRAAIEAEVARGDLPPTLQFAFYMPGWLDRLRNRGMQLGFESLTAHLVHLAWQWLAYRHVRSRLQGQAFDLVHHVTYSGIRHPTFMGRLPYPLVLGPLGGGERAPFSLRRGLPWHGWLMDLVRDLHTWFIRIEPITRRACADALVIYVKTEQSREALPARFRDKAAVQMEVGIRDVTRPARAARPAGEPLRLLYAGRFLYWKGMHLGLKALARFLADGGQARLTMLGRGPDEQTWRELARELGIEHAISWVSWVDHAKMGELYAAHDALIFPSLHDSSGNTVLESLAHGLPVICLDLGGPAEIVDPGCGRIIVTKSRSEAECVRGLAEAMAQLSGSPELCERLSEGARVRARQFFWPKQVMRVYQDIERRLQPRLAEPAAGARERVPAGGV